MRESAYRAHDILVRNPKEKRMTYVTRPFFLLVETFWPVLPLVVVVDLVAVYLLVFRERMDPRSFAFWMVLFIAFPLTGFILYLLFGCTLYVRREYGRKMESDRAAGLLGDSLVTGAGPLAGGNDVRFMPLRDEALRGIASEIGSASASVHMEVRQAGDISEVLGLLCSKASEGIDVRVLFSRRSREIRRLRD